jgi:hypothetical protein
MTDENYLSAAFNHSPNNDAEAEYDRLRDLARQAASKRSSCFDRVCRLVTLRLPLTLYFRGLLVRDSHTKHTSAVMVPRPRRSQRKASATEPKRTDTISKHPSTSSAKTMLLGAWPMIQ